MSLQPLNTSIVSGTKEPIFFFSYFLGLHLQIVPHWLAFRDWVFLNKA